MLGNCNIGTAAGEARCVRLVHFEHTVCLLESTRCGTMAELGYEVEYVHLSHIVRVRTMEDTVTKNKTYQRIIHLLLFCRSMITAPLLLFQVACHVINLLNHQFFVCLLWSLFYQLYQEIDILCIHSIEGCCTCCDDIPVNLINAQMPEYSGVIVDDFIHQIGLDRSTIGPDTRFHKMVQHIGVQVVRGVGIHVAWLELEWKESCAFDEPIHTAWNNRYEIWEIV